MIVILLLWRLDILLFFELAYLVLLYVHK